MPNAGHPKVREAVARRLSAATGLPYTANHVLMTVGAGAALNTVLKALLDPGDEVITVAPFFAEYTFYAEARAPTDADARQPLGARHPPDVLGWAENRERLRSRLGCRSRDAILGGEAIVAGTRVPVRAVVEFWRLGVAPEEVPTHLPHLTPAQVFDASPGG